VEVAIDRQQMIGVKTVAAAIRPMKKTLRTIGRVEYDERKLTTVNSKVEGWVDRLYANYTGQYVKKGTPLVDLYSPELMSIQLEYLNLLKWRPALGIRYQRNVEINLGDRYNTLGRLTIQDLDPLVDLFKEKFALWEISEEEIKEIETSKKPMRTLTIKSPASGYVFQKPVFKGTRVAPGDKIFDIVDLSTVWVLADIYEYEIPFVKVGQNARITLSYYPGKEFTARVDFIYPFFSGQTRTAKARFVLHNPNMLLKPQMFTNIEMELDLGKRFAIPETAILDTGTRQIVYVDMGDGYFAAQQIKTGERANGMVEVLSGLKDGEKVAYSAVFLIDSEAKLKGVAQ
ncbi:MAG: efflux RND transporter periplasmic adaptor subunit, partial [Syntrophorhabdaceae bacterium]|nr:efflux RND transporter periplasmic adaptor subunit [Syntrophorhabdaceae bacterium]